MIQTNKKTAKLIYFFVEHYVFMNLKLHIYNKNRKIYDKFNEKLLSFLP